MAVVVLAVSPALAFEIPETGNPTFIQTNGPQAPIERGDWYTSPDNGIGAGYHYFTLNVPCSWPAALDIHIDIFSPGINTGGGTQDELNGFQPGDGIFEVYAPPTAVGPITQPDVPGPGAPGSLYTDTYTSNLPSPNTGEDWFRFYTIPGNAYDCTGAYVLRAETTGASENAWRVRLGYDDDLNPNNPPPPNNDNPDGRPGTDDELTVGVARTSYQHEEGGQTVCLTLLKFVEPNAVQTEFQNFDMDLDAVGNNARVTYYAPSDPNYDPTGITPGIFGTASGFTEWNNSDVNRGPGDVITNPEPGWWRIVACVNDNNQYIVEGEFYTQPPTPRMIVEKDDGKTVVARGEVLDYVINFANVSDQDPAPGAARRVRLVDTLPPETTYIPNSCAINPPYTGTCAYTAGNPATITYILNEPVFAGDGGSVTFSAQVNADVFPPQDIENVVVLTYTDSAGRPFPPETDNDIDVTTLRDPEMILSKDDGRVLVARGDTLIYNIDFTNISDTTPTPDSANNVELVDTLPANTAYQGCSIEAPFTGTCQQTAPRRVIYRLDQPVPPGQSGRVTLTVRVSLDALDPQYNREVFNTVELTYTDSSGEPQAPLNATDLDVLVDTPIPRPLMSVMKDDWKETVQIGETLTYRIDFRSLADTLPNPEPAYNVVLTDDVPGNVNYISCEILAPFTGTCGSPDEGQTVVYRLNEVVNPGQGGRVLMNVSVAPWADADEYGRRVVNWVHLDYTNSFGLAQPRVSDDDIDTLVDAVICEGDLLIRKRALPPFALPGDTVTWEVIITNPGDIPVRDAAVTDIIPAIMQIISATATAGELTVEGQTIQWRKDVVEAREVIVITVVTQVRDDAPVPFIVNNLATLTANCIVPKSARATVISVTQLANTGESPWDVYRPLVVGTITLMLAAGAWKILRR